jgi:hypothetical protein
MIHFEAKRSVLLLHRMRQQESYKDTISAIWTQKWTQRNQGENPPDRNKVPQKFNYLQKFHIESAYVTRQGSTETPKAYKRKIYTTMFLLHTRQAEDTGMRIQKLWPPTDWTTVWKKCSYDACLSGNKSIFVRRNTCTLHTSHKREVAQDKSVYNRQTS